MAPESVTFTTALRTALTDAMNDDLSVLLMGEDIGLYGGAFGVTRGLLDTFGPDRVRETPICEAGFTGVAVGAALGGLRPVVEIMFSDFLTLAADALINQAAKFRYMYGDDGAVPLVVRAPTGGGRGYGPTHSQCMEALFLGVPGLQVIAPGTVQSAYSLLRWAIACPDPVLFMESKLLYGEKGPLDRNAPITAPAPRIEAKGDRLTLISCGPALPLARRAHKALAADGISADLIDLEQLWPIDPEPIIAAASRTGRVLIVDEAPIDWGAGTRLVRLISEQSFFDLEAPPALVAAQSNPVPAAPHLEQESLPSLEQVLTAASSLFG